MVPAVTAAALGIQLAFSGFALAMLEFGRELRLKRAGPEPHGDGPAAARPGPGRRPALLLWPTLLNWHPYLFWDTYGYFLQGKAYAQLLLGWIGLAPPPPETGAGWIGAAGRMLARDPSIRSPTWSLLTYGLAAGSGAGFWLLALFDALVAAADARAALVRLFGARRSRAGSWCWPAMTLADAAALVRQLPDARPLRRPAGAGGGAAGVRLGPPEPRPSGSAPALLYLGSITFHLSHLLLAAWPAGTGRAPARGRVRRLERLLRLGPAAPGGGGPAARRGLGSASARPTLDPQRRRRSCWPGPGRTGRPAPIWSGLPGGGLGDLPLSRPPRRHRAGVPVAAARQLLGHGPAERGPPCAPRSRRSCCARCWPIPAARSAPRWPTWRRSSAGSGWTISCSAAAPR